MVRWLPFNRREVLFFAVGFGISLVFTMLRSQYIVIDEYGISLRGFADRGFVRNKGVNQGADRIPIPMEPFPEPRWITNQTLAVRTVTSTPFARFEIHKVQTESGAIIEDWLWTDERSHVNILVHLKEEDKYLLFYQKKYGLKEPKYAAIGGLYNPGDTPDGCAKRELLEETGLQAQEMVNLGAYRVQVNRGGGILHAFFAFNCSPVKLKSGGAAFEADYESQEHRKLTRKELIQVALSGEIGEAQWLATIATALLYHDNKELYKPLAP